jgi:hypothetical protein
VTPVRASVHCELVPYVIAQRGRFLDDGVDHIRMIPIQGYGETEVGGKPVSDIDPSVPAVEGLVGSAVILLIENIGFLRVYH